MKLAWWSGESAVITEVSQYRRIPDLKTAVASEKLWNDYGIFFLFFSPICPWSFFSRGYEPEIGNQPRAYSSPCRAKTSSDDSQDYHRNYSKMFEAVDYLSRAYSTVHSDQKEINVVSLMFILFFEEKSWDPRRVFIFRTKV